jgi:hypothetical protein
MQGLIKDPRFPENTWGKFEYVHRGLNGENITVHFWRNLLDGMGIISLTHTVADSIF